MADLTPITLHFTISNPNAFLAAYHKALRTSGYEAADKARLLAIAAEGGTNPFTGQPAVEAALLEILSDAINLDTWGVQIS
jgi:hypothetical protein